MSKPLTRTAASAAFARGDNFIRTGAALTFSGDVAYSYAEPIAVRVGGKLYVTTAKFSMTTSHHRGSVAGKFAVENGSDNVIDTDHGQIRKMTRERKLPCGDAGRGYDPVKAGQMVPDGHGFFRKVTDAEVQRSEARHAA